MADHRANAYWEHDDGVDRAILRASALGAECEASLVRSLAGQPEAPSPPSMSKALEDGIRAEPVLLARLADYGWKMQGASVMETFGPTNHDQVLVEIKAGKHRVRCHPDGIALRMDRAVGEGVRMLNDEPEWSQAGQYAVVEAKALAPSTFEKLRRNGWGLEAYRWQVAVEMIATGLPGLMVVGVKDEAGDIDEVWVKYVTEPPVSQVEIIQRVLRVVKAAGEMEAGLGAPECDVKMFPCPHYRNGGLCGENTGDGVKGRTGQDEDLAETLDDGQETKRLIWEVRKARTERDRWDERVRDRTAELLAHIDAHGHPNGRYGGFGLSVSRPKVGRVSWQKVAAELRGDLADDEWDQLQDEARGKVPAPVVKITEEDT